MENAVICVASSALGAAAILLPYGLPAAAGGASLGAGVGAFGAFLVLLYYYYKIA